MIQKQVFITELSPLKTLLAQMCAPTGTNVLEMCAPTQFNLHSLSCVNKEIEIFKRKLYKIMKTFQHVQICDISLITLHDPWCLHKHIRQRLDY
jgi:hypothetical protein